MSEEVIDTTATESQDDKFAACNKEINDILQKYGFTLQVAHIPQLIPLQERPQVAAVSEEPVQE